MANGILVIDKSAGWTSQDVAAKLRGVFHERRVGHGGTHFCRCNYNAFGQAVYQIAALNF